MTVALMARDERHDVATMDVAALKAELAGQLTLTAHSLQRAAEIWSELINRGEDVQGLRSGLGFYLPRIARGELAAEAVVAFAGQRMLLQRMCGLPIEEQRRLASGGAITVAERTPDGEIVGVERKPDQLSSRAVLLAFGDRQMRPLRAQINTLAREAIRPAKRAAKSDIRIRADVVHGQILIGRLRIEPSDLSSALAALGMQIGRKP